MRRFRLTGKGRIAGLATALAGMLAAGPAPALTPPWGADAGVELSTNDNIGQAEFDRDIIDEQLLTLDAGLTFSRILGSGNTLWARGFVETRQTREIRGLSRHTLGGSLGLDGQFVLGPEAPFYRLALKLQGDDYRHRQRDSSIATVSAEVGKPWGETLTTSAGAEYRNRHARSEVFTLSQWRAFVSGRLGLPRGWGLHGTFSHIDGDVWSVARTRFANGAVADDIFPLVRASTALEPDDAFNDAFSGRWLAYRLSAITHTLRIGVSKQLRPDTSLDLSWLEVRVRADGGNDYDSRLFQLALRVRF